MTFVYEPQGRAREYSPLALNIYTGCDHKCRYCYGQNIRTFTHGEAVVRKTLTIAKLERELERKKYDQQVLLSFMGDPYCAAETRNGWTRRVLEALLRHEVPVAILTKGGMRCLRDIDLYGLFAKIKVGATLTFHNPKDSEGWEPGAASPTSRLHALKQLHDIGIRTWVSMEPVIRPDQTLGFIDLTCGYVDEYKIGKLNHYPEIEEKIDWGDFGDRAVAKLRAHRKDFYIKKDLREYLSVHLEEHEQDCDYLCRKWE